MSLYGNPFAYPAFDLLSGELLDTIPYAGVTFGRMQNQPGSWAGQLPLADPRVGAFSWQRASQPSRTALFVELAGRLVWGGIVWTRTYDSTSPGKVLSVGAMEFGSYFQSRLQAADYSTTWAAGADPMTIAQTVLADAQAHGTVMGGITVKLNPVGGEGGPQITPSYPGTSLQSIDSIVSTLSQQGYTLGFDYSFDAAYVRPGVPGITLNLWYPRQGRQYGASQLVVLAKDVIGFTYPEDGTQQAGSVGETGSGTGGIQPATASVSLPDYPLLEKSIARTMVNDQATLSNIALGDLGLYCYPVVTPSLILPVPLPGPDGSVSPTGLRLGEFDVGDDLRWRIDKVAGGGENTDPRFPQGMDFVWRISGWTCTPQDKGVPTVKVDLAVPPLESLPPPPPPL